MQGFKRPFPDDKFRTAQQKRNGLLVDVKITATVTSPQYTSLSTRILVLTSANQTPGEVNVAFLNWALHFAMKVNL